MNEKVAGIGPLKTMELLQLLSSPAVGTHILTKGMNCISFLRRD